MHLKQCLSRKIDGLSGCTNQRLPPGGELKTLLRKSAEGEGET